MAEGYIYAQLARTLRVVKVGLAKNPYARRGNLQVGCPVPLITYAVRKSANMLEDERRVHLAMDQWRLPGRREWFQFNAATRSYLKSWRQCHDATERPPDTIEEIMESESLPVLVPRSQVEALLLEARRESSVAVVHYEEIIRRLVRAIGGLTPRDVETGVYHQMHDLADRVLEKHDAPFQFGQDILRLCSDIVTTRGRDLNEQADVLLKGIENYAKAVNARNSQTMVDMNLFV